MVRIREVKDRYRGLHPNTSLSGPECGHTPLDLLDTHPSEQCCIVCMTEILSVRLVLRGGIGYLSSLPPSRLEWLAGIIYSNGSNTARVTAHRRYLRYQRCTPIDSQ